MHEASPPWTVQDAARLGPPPRPGPAAFRKCDHPHLIPATRDRLKVSVANPELQSEVALYIWLKWIDAP